MFLLRVHSHDLSSNFDEDIFCQHFQIFSHIVFNELELVIDAIGHNH